MAALGHTSTLSCFVICQLLGFFPGQVHLSEVPFDDIYPVLPWSSWFSLVTLSSQCVAWRAVLELSILKTCPSHLSLLSLIISSSFLEPVFFLMSSFLTLSLHVIPNSLPWNLWWAASNFFIRVTDSGHDSAPYNRVEMTSDSYVNPHIQRVFENLTLWCPLLPYGYSILCQTGLSRHL